jgi:hypothetical protein
MIPRIFQKAGSRRLPALAAFADCNDLPGLVKELDADPGLIVDLEAAVQRALDEQRPWRVLFFVAAAAYARQREALARVAPLALDQVRDRNVWGALDGDDIVAMLRFASFDLQVRLLSTIPLEQWLHVGENLPALSRSLRLTGAWMAARLGQWTRYKQVHQACRARLAQLTERQRRALGRIVRRAAPNAALHVAIVGLQHSELAAEILPALLEARPGELAWKELSDAEFLGLVEVVQKACSDQLAAFLTTLPDDRRRQATHHLATRRLPGEAPASISVRDREAALEKAESAAAAKLAGSILALGTPRPSSKAVCSSSELLADQVRRARDEEMCDLEADLRQSLREAIRSRTPPSRVLLEALSDSLPRLPLRQAVVAAQLLARGPSPSWEQSLRGLWLHAVPICRFVCRRSEVYEDLDVWRPLQSIAAQAAVAAAEALAACSALRTQSVRLEDDERKLGPLADLEQRMTRLAKAHQDKVDFYHRLRAEYSFGEQTPPGESDIERMLQRFEIRLSPPDSLLRGGRSAGSNASLELRLSQLQDEIAKLETDLAALATQRDQLWSEIKPQLSSAWLFVNALRNTRLESPDVVQAAARALAVLLEHEAMDESSSPRVRETLRAVFQGDTAFHLRERAIRLLPNSDECEAAAALRAGVLWMSSLEPYFSPDPLEEWLVDDECLNRIAELLCERMPGVIRFLESYPLRLMRFGEHRRAFGVYRTSGAEIEFWYQFDRPQDEGGTVSRRYLQIDDRMQPNSIGLHYHLLRHPLLALPVLYHEFLHYGGTTGREEDGIANELEVLLREIAFAKALMADLAPDDDEAIPQFENEILDACRQADNAIGLVHQWLEDPFAEEVFVRLNQEVPFVYRSWANPENDIHLANLDIEAKNLDVTWSAWVWWPLLGQPETRHLTEEYLRLRRRHAELRHDLTLQRCREIQYEPEVAQQLARWKSYTERSHSLEVLGGYRNSWADGQALSLELLAQLMILRFPGLLSHGYGAMPGLASAVRQTTD